MHYSNQNIFSTETEILMALEYIKYRDGNVYNGQKVGMLNNNHDISSIISIGNLMLIGSHREWLPYVTWRPCPAL